MALATAAAVAAVAAAAATARPPWPLWQCSGGYQVVGNGAAPAAVVEARYRLFTCT